jgi:hypothetical protein
MTDNYPFSAWRTNLCDAIRSFADIEYQRRVWVNGEGPEVDSYVEAMCHLFDDNSFDEFLATAAAERHLRTDQVAALNDFRIALEAFDKANSDMTDASIVVHPRWPNVCRYADVALSALDQ